MAVFPGELGLQFVTHLANHHTVSELVRLADLGQRWVLRPNSSSETENA